jgi:hypothetical protein
MNPGASAGRIPANVSLADRASVTAGFAKEVDDVNQSAERSRCLRRQIDRHFTPGQAALGGAGERHNIPP